MDKTWRLQGTTPTTIGATDFLAFSNSTFGESILVDEYNEGTHVRSDAGADSSSANTPRNSMYVASGTVNIGGGTVNLNTISEANCPLRITVGESTNITVTDVEMYAFDGTTDTAAPDDVDVYLAEQGDTSWTEAHGSNNALELDDSDSPAQDHDFYVLISVKPTDIGVKDENELKFKFIYQ